MVSLLLIIICFISSWLLQCMVSVMVLFRFDFLVIWLMFMLEFLLVGLIIIGRLSLCVVVCILVLVLIDMKCGVGRLCVSYICLVWILFMFSVELSMFELVYGMVKVFISFCMMLFLFLLLWLWRMLNIWLKWCLVRVWVSVGMLFMVVVLILWVCSVLIMLWLELSDILCLLELLLSSIVMWLKVVGLVMCSEGNMNVFIWLVFFGNCLL